MKIFEVAPILAAMRLRNIRGQRFSKKNRTQYSAVAEPLELRLLLSSYALTTLAEFSSTNGALPNSTLVADCAGNLFGTTTIGGSSNDGTVFEIAYGATTITTLASFNLNNGANPDAGVILDSNGDLFGTTEYGGDLTLSGGYGDGTLFELSRDTGTIATVASFNGTDGAYPTAGLTGDSNGDFFGTTWEGGANHSGTIFEITNGSGTITTLASFNNTDGDSNAGVTMDSSNNLFDTTENGGANGDGMVFEIANGSGVITTLASFNKTNGANPLSGVALDSSGDLFGTTLEGGAYGIDGLGTVFEIAQASGTITTLASFNGINGTNPIGSVTLDSSGDIFGMTEEGGGNFTNTGTVFEITQGSGAITTLASFNGIDGALPTTGVILDSNGDLFGTTGYGGVGYTEGYSGDGTVFEVHALHLTIEQPANATAGKSISPAVIVDIEDANDNIVNTDNSTVVTMSVNSGPGGLSGTLQATAKHGVVTFSKLVLKIAGNYSLAVSGGWDAAPGTSGDFTVTPAAASKLAFVQQPTNVTAGDTITPPVGVAVEDKYGNIETGDSTDVIMLSVATGPGSLVGGSIAATASDGIATFSTVTLEFAGKYTLKAASGAMSGKSASFTVRAAAVANLAFVQQPLNAVAGAKIAPAVTVRATDAFGNLVPGAAVTINLASDPAGGTLLGGLTENTSTAGLASFSSLSIRTAGVYTLGAIDGAVSAAPSVLFTITGLAAAKLVYVILPADTTDTSTFQVEVAVEDKYGNVTNSLDGTSMSLALGTRPAGGILGGYGGAVTITGGLASFTGLQLATPGNYTLKAMAGSLTITSGIITVFNL